MHNTRSSGITMWVCGCMGVNERSGIKTSIGSHEYLVSFPDPPSGGCGEREKEGMDDNPGRKCPGGMLWLHNN